MGPLVIGGRSDPHHGPDDGRKVVPVGAAHHDDESSAGEKAEHEVARFEKYHAAHHRDRRLRVRRASEHIKLSNRIWKRYGFVTVPLSNSYLSQLGGVPAACPIEQESAACNGQQRAAA